MILLFFFGCTGAEVLVCARQEDALGIEICEIFAGTPRGCACVLVFCATTTIVSWLFVLRPSCRGDAGRRCRPEMWLCYVMLLPAGDAGHKCLWMKCLQVSQEALEFAGTSINFRSGKFGYSICPFFSKGHAEIFRKYWHDFAKK